MLGEDHALLLDFPEFEARIIDLTATDVKFAESSVRYHKLDKESRELELINTPIDDTEFTRLKRQRAELKDALYLQLMAQQG